MRMMRKKCFVLIPVMVVVLLGATSCSNSNGEVVEVIGLESTEQQESLEEVSLEEEENVVTTEEIKVYICGEIANTGVYDMDEGDRICDIIDKAGGFTEYASTMYLNQAELIIDGQKIYVPTVEEVEAGASLLYSSAEEEDGKVNLNTASKEELMTLTGIGESKAEAIIAYREDNGGFETIEDIQNISGIKEAVFSTIEDQICV